MRFLINASNIHAGGGMQVTDSLCMLLSQYKSHSFVIVLSSFFKTTRLKLAEYDNVECVQYDVKKSLSAFWGRNKYLDNLVSRYRIDAVLTVFGPSYWKPKCVHLCGMARPHLVLPDSPFFKNVSLIQKIKYKLWSYFFKECSDYFYTENPFVTKRLQDLFGSGKKVCTITNYYHQVYDHPDEWDNSIELPPFNGYSIITISSPNAHKNFPITADIIKSLRDRHPDFSIRFVLTQNREDCPFISEDLLSYYVFLGPVDVRCCPHLYEQCDIMFQPSLLECFSATYPEAMRMDVPIVTTDLEFAKGLCGHAACYYEAVNPVSAADAIFQVATDKAYASQLVSNGKKQLQLFDNYVQRADKLIKTLELITINKEDEKENSNN